MSDMAVSDNRESSSALSMGTVIWNAACGAVAGWAREGHLTRTSGGLCESPRERRHLELGRLPLSSRWDQSQGLVCPEQVSHADYTPISVFILSV